MTEPGYIGHARQVLADGVHCALNEQAAKADEPIIDAYTASAMVAVWDALAPEQRQFIIDRDVPLLRYVDLCWKAAS